MGNMGVCAMTKEDMPCGHSISERMGLGTFIHGRDPFRSHSVEILNEVLNWCIPCMNQVIEEKRKQRRKGNGVGQDAG